jgi:hypothetical protein
MRGEVDDYVDTKLANFEVVLEKTITAVRRGRDKLSGRSAAGDLAPDQEGFEGGDLPGGELPGGEPEPSRGDSSRM